jgi:hypothetical protein
MGAKPKARPSASKAKKPKGTQKEQSARFIEAARAIGVDESGREFDRALSKIIPARGRRKTR